MEKDALKKIVSEKITENQSLMPRNLAQELSVSEGSIIEALPEQMRVAVPVEEFVVLWEAMTEWEKVTFFAETPGAIIEISCALPKGKMGHGMYNLMDKKFPLGGHLLVRNIASIWLVSKPAFGLESHSVQFFSEQGLPCFSVYLGRDASRAIIPSVRDGYMQLWRKYSASTGATL